MKTHANAGLSPHSATRPERRRVAQLGRTSPWMLAGILLLAACAALWWWKSRSAAGAADASAQTAGPAGSAGKSGGGKTQSQPVSVQPARRLDIHVTVNAIGTITASNTATVHAQVSGVLQSLNFKEGQQVKANQVLAIIDPRAFEASLAQAKGALARDRAQLENARIDLTRYRDLVAKDAVPKQQLDTQIALVRQLEGTVEADKGVVDSAQLQLSYTRIVAPIAGRAGLKQVDLGNVVQPSDANGVVTITQTKPIALIFSVPSARLPQITAKLNSDTPLPVEAWDSSGSTRLAVGHIASTDNAIDVSTDTIKLKALFANDDDVLFPNQPVSVRLQVSTLANSLAVPQAAVQRGTQGFYVYLLNSDKTVSTRAVKSGPVDGDWMAVEGALQAGDNVVTDGVDRLRDGAKVDVIAPGPARQAAANPAGSGVQAHAQKDAAPASSAANRQAPSSPPPSPRPGTP
ncbi:MdtA/MuxA family multidrug efflux RND transporter periplasmic adaptor subunit [Undibacterium sp.]|uniref:MdtA/MuxA family multidrug efflux RND transporter periplasmic adaptor subunit n=1 Tax=Undibacterium sp. TaxID=1914977 RepID=UPI002C07F80D|nr:MdtA/MuxA family multidrug efflux RND transporter periplasmic adaptor subunit [Undibacterium sp.]HTD04794.1 MdtA/MuxA family multidrug efflux RND transporter periplasmic adaptor subunit [Undibacterium sp.]